MMMEKREIAKMYREAKNKTKQIRILQELNLCSREEIIKILEEEGEMPKKENPHNSDGGMEAGNEEMQKEQGKKRAKKPKNALNAEAEMSPEEMLKLANAYFEKVEQKIRWMEQQTEILQKVATGLADTIEGLALMTESGKEE